MLAPRFVVQMLSVGMIVFAAGVVSGEGYPNKPIRIVTLQAGGGTDVAFRRIAEPVAGSLGQQIVIDNRAIVGVEIVARAEPDGYTLLHYTNPLWLMPLFRDSVPWDPVRDFAPITLTMRTPAVVAVHLSVPVKSIKELIALAKARPGELNYGSSSTGAVNHVAAELFKAMAGVDIVRVNYKGGTAAVMGLLAGELHLMINSAGSLLPYVRAGRLRALAVTSAEPSALAPGLPTVAASGLPGYEAWTMAALFAPVKTPVAIINRLNKEIVHALQRAEIKERLFNSGIEVVASSREELAAAIKFEMARMRKVVKDSGLRE